MLVLALVAGCSSAAVEVTTASNGDVTALVRTTNLSSGDAGFEGLLAVSDAGCLGITPVDGDGSVAPVVWPTGTRVTDDGALRTPDGSVVAVGEMLAGGGDVVDDLRGTYGDAVAGCADDGQEGALLGEVAPGDLADLGTGLTGRRGEPPQGHASDVRPARPRASVRGT
ncbi:hypothetical protein [Cellulomonas sp. SLBN-39]|uniref:hypothetical protein n=1 Tax=Cellulomonas sp. SLBN-39 TaxID=2768446 RepID=UPI0011513D91|nr:hypothetical protein [Cellulomonas sp. SLBN-39]